MQYSSETPLEAACDMDQCTELPSLIVSTLMGINNCQ
jgi:hypothetical protein